MTSPTLVNVVGLAVLVIVRAGFWLPVTVALGRACVCTVVTQRAGMVNVPASTSAWVMLWVPVHVIDAPGARLAAGTDGVQLKPVSPVESLTFTFTLFPYTTLFRSIV